MVDRWTVNGFQFPLVAPRADAENVKIDERVVEIKRGEEVRKIDAPVEEKEGDTVLDIWQKIEASEGRQGYVLASAVEKLTDDTTPLSDITVFKTEVLKENFAEICLRQAVIIRTNPAYLYALAFCESGASWTEEKITSPKEKDGAVGTFQFVPKTWASLIQDPTTTDITAEDIAFPQTQCIVAAVQSTKAASLISGFIGNRGISAVDLYLAHLFGSDGVFGSSGAKIILDAERANENAPIKEALDKIYADDATERVAFLKRKAHLLAQGETTSVKKFLAACTKSLDKGFEKVKELAHEIKASLPTNSEDPLLGEQIRGQGWEILISRIREETRGAGKRTVGTYQVFHDGQPVQSLSGMICEAKGPGDNSKAGDKYDRRIEAGTYPLYTQNGEKYKTIGYKNSASWSAVPRPGIELKETGKRTEILIHPARGFLWSVGCFNTTDNITNASSDMNFVESRKRTIALIENMKQFLDGDFPKQDGKKIPRAFAVIGGARSGTTPSDFGKLEPLIKLIVEGESKGNYEAFIGNTKNMNKPRLTSMSLDEIKNFQKKLVAQGKPSGAVGRYQIISITLDYLIGKLKLAGNDIFNESLQDRMAEQLLNRRGLKAYLSSPLTKETIEKFALELAKEWAALPVPYDVRRKKDNVLIRKGQSYYRGTAGNKAQISLAAILTVLKQVKA